MCVFSRAVTFYPKHVGGYWAKVARIVGTRSAEECHNQHTSQGTSQTPAKKPKKRKEEAPKHSGKLVLILLFLIVFLEIHISYNTWFTEAEVDPQLNCFDPQTVRNPKMFTIMMEWIKERGLIGLLQKMT